MTKNTEKKDILNESENNEDVTKSIPNVAQQGKSSYKDSLSEAVANNSYVKYTRKMAKEESNKGQSATETEKKQMTFRELDISL